VVFGNIFCIYIALFSSFLVDSHKEGVWVLLLLPLSFRVVRLTQWAEKVFLVHLGINYF
jgi:hypothetical protein